MPKPLPQEVVWIRLLQPSWNSGFVTLSLKKFDSSSPFLPAPLQFPVIFLCGDMDILRNHPFHLTNNKPAWTLKHSCTHQGYNTRIYFLNLLWKWDAPICIQVSFLYVLIKKKHFLPWHAHALWISELACSDSRQGDSVACSYYSEPAKPFLWSSLSVNARQTYH